MQRQKTILAVCGLTLSLASAPALLAQSRGTGASQPRDTQERQTESTRASAVLDQLEGIWAVDVRVDAEHWSEMQRSKERRDEMRRPGNRQTDPKERPTRSNERDDERKTEGETIRFSGVAENQLVLDDTVLRQRIVMAGGSGATRGSATSTISGLSFFAFDPERDRYEAVFMRSDGTMHTDTGKYDARSKRIVFDGREPARQGRGQNVRVVLEVLSADTHRVTMYSGAVPNRPSGDDSDNSNDRDARDEQRSNELGENVVYQATYSRAPEGQRERVRAALDAIEGEDDRRRRGGGENDQQR